MLVFIFKKKIKIFLIFFNFQIILTATILNISLYITKIVVGEVFFNFLILFLKIILIFFIVFYLYIY
jgi:hypothetical protein